MHAFTISIKSIVFHVNYIDCRSPPRMPASYHCSRIILHLGNSPVLRVTAPVLLFTWAIALCYELLSLAAADAS